MRYQIQSDLYSEPSRPFGRGGRVMAYRTRRAARKAAAELALTYWGPTFSVFDSKAGKVIFTETRSRF